MTVKTADFRGDIYKNDKNAELQCSPEPIDISSQKTLCLCYNTKSCTFLGLLVNRKVLHLPHTHLFVTHHTASSIHTPDNKNVQLSLFEEEIPSWCENLFTKLELILWLMLDLIHNRWQGFLPFFFITFLARWKKNIHNWCFPHGKNLERIPTGCPNMFGTG